MGKLLRREEKQREVTVGVLVDLKRESRVFSRW